METTFNPRLNAAVGSWSELRRFLNVPLHAGPQSKRNTAVTLAEAVEILIAVCGANKTQEWTTSFSFSTLTLISAEIKRLSSLFLLCRNGTARGSPISA